MKLQEVKHQMNLREWSEQIKAREESGLNVTKWCTEQGISKTSYYYRLNKVQEEYLNALESANKYQMDGLSGKARSHILEQNEPTVFAAFPMPQNKSAAVTVRIGGCVIDIQNGADSTVVEQVLKAVSRL